MPFARAIFLLILQRGGDHMENQNRLSDSVLIEIIHGIENVVIEFIRRAFSSKEK